MIGYDTCERERGIEEEKRNRESVRGSGEHLRLLRLTEGEYPVLKWNEQSAAVVNSQLPVYFKKRIFKVPKEEKIRVAKTRESADLHYDAGLFEALRELRLQCAREEQIPPFVVSLLITAA